VIVDEVSHCYEPVRPVRCFYGPEYTTEQWRTKFNCYGTFRSFISSHFMAYFLDPMSILLCLECYNGR